MSFKGGLAGKILRVDLSSGRTWEQETEEYAREYIGGRAIGSYILFNELDKSVSWSDPENIIIFGAGALVGTLTPAACRVSIDTKNVFNNGKGSANVGGHFGPELKYAGFDHVVISGKSEKPVYLHIYDGKAELRDGRYIWGKTTFGTEDILEREHAPHKIRVAAIGPAGESLVRGSGIVIDRGKVAGGSGVGCIMGDKKLKALVVCGEKGSIQVADPKAFFKAVDIGLQKVKRSPYAAMIKKNTPAGCRYVDSEDWNLLTSVRNGQDGFWEREKREKLLNPETGFSKFRKKIFACATCPMGCMPFFEINEGRYKGASGSGFWLNAIGDAARLDITDSAGMLKAWILCNELGLDTDFAASVISWAYECYEKGLLDSKDTDGLKLEWGNVDAYIEMLKKLAYQQGIGAFLAQGSQAASKRLGKESESFAVHVKGQDSRESFIVGKGWALGIATSPVAGRHLRGATLGGKSFGPQNASFDATAYEHQAKYVFWQSLTKEMEDMLGICSYVGTWDGAYALEPSDYVSLTNSALGKSLTEKDLFTIAQRSYNLEKAFNTLHTNFDRKDDYPPKRFFEEPIKAGPFKGWRCEKEKWDEMLDEFYQLHGWDVETGLQTQMSLIQLGMDKVAQKLEKAGRLIKK